MPSFSRLQLKRSFKYFAVLVLSTQLSFCGNGIAGSDNWTEVLDSIRQNFPDVPQISTQDLAKWNADGSRQAPIIFDTREKDEYLISHLPAALHLDPKSDLGSSLAKTRKDHPIVVYCSVGYRSSEIAQELRKLGFSNVFNLEGSIFKWANEGRTIVAEEQPVSKVHPYDTEWGELLDRKYHP